jgi:hypothetical protein
LMRGALPSAIVFVRRRAKQKCIFLAGSNDRFFFLRDTSIFFS